MPRSRLKPYSVICTINEKENKTEEIRCLDCVASAGGCKHSIALLMWLHHRSEEPAPTSVSCYWNKPILSRIGSNIKFVKAVDIGRKMKAPVLNVASLSQSEYSLWHELRFGRVTASKLYDAAVCKFSSSALVNQIMGVRKLFQTAAMKRGITLEKAVIKELEKQINCPIRPSGFIVKKNGVIGASPDGITDDSIHIPKEGKVAKKFWAQINLQMLAMNVKKGIFCVASPDFEQTKKITVVNVEYDAEFMEYIIDCALYFWKTIKHTLMYKIEE
ncbi:hypothetical protein NQ315_014476 [Exocentrus adspersus]|uniref:YqaJ viral recombinase domain-containing protein n=1 Tax=Exocentrus adspersus TaxID=1586481 RepID=A0AAV8VEU0_9CUCU|nr:hypothetical protein NQ315_014476 [Exocentrus adspersus]